MSVSGLTDYDSLRSTPSTFVANVLGVTPFEYQTEFLDSDDSRKCFTSGRQVGKSRCCAWYGLHRAATTQNTLVLITAPSLRQSSNLFKQLRTEMSQAGATDATISDDAWGIDRDTQTIIEFENDSEIHCLPTGRNGNQIRGYTADLIIVDEAAFIDDSIFEDVLEPMTFATDGELVLASTPYGTSGYFYQAFNDPDWYSQRVASWDNPLIEDEDLERFTEGKTRAQIKREVEGRFVEDADSFLSTELIREALGTPERRTDDVYLGADIAAAGTDETVLTLLDGSANVFDIEAYQDMGVLEAADRIQVLDNHYGFETIGVDRTGLGTGTVESLRERTGIGRRIEDIYLTIQTKQSVYQALKSELQAGAVTLPHDEMLQTQLDALTFTKRSSGNISIHAADDVHDDYCDSLAIGIWILPETPGGAGTNGARGATSTVSLGDMRSSSPTQPDADSTALNARDASRSSNRDSSRQRRGSTNRRRSYRSGSN